MEDRVTTMNLVLMLLNAFTIGIFGSILQMRVVRLARQNQPVVKLVLVRTALVVTAGLMAVVALILFALFHE